LQDSPAASGGLSVGVEACGPNCVRPARLNTNACEAPEALRNQKKEGVYL